MDTAGLIGRAHAAKIGGHVGNYKVELVPIQNTFEASVRRLFPEISADDRNSRYRRNFQKIDCNDASGPPDAFRKGLCPAPWRGAEIDHMVPLTREPVPFRDFDQLVGRARAVTFGSGPMHVRIADVALEPCAAGFASGHSLMVPTLGAARRPEYYDRWWKSGYGNDRSESRRAPRSGDLGRNAGICR